MTTRYHVPEGTTSVSANGQTFAADENGHIDVGTAFPGTVELLVGTAGCRPVKTEDDLQREADDAAEKVRYDAAVAEMLASLMAKPVSIAEQVVESAVQAAAEAEAALAERTVREAVVAAAEVEQVTPSEPADPVPASGLIPPPSAKRKKA